jgi:hypothetical protein
MGVFFSQIFVLRTAHLRRSDPQMTVVMPLSIAHLTAS